MKLKLKLKRCFEGDGDGWISNYMMHHPKNPPEKSIKLTKGWQANKHLETASCKGQDDDRVYLEAAGGAGTGGWPW